MIVLGFDPGLALTGYGVIEHKPNRIVHLEDGVIRTTSDLSTSERLLIIYNEGQKIIRKYKPSVIAVEKLFFNQNTSSALSVGQARGVLFVVAALHGIPVYEYTPQQVKGAVSGYGRATKQQVGKMVKTLLGLPKVPKPDDAADALAVAICHGSFASQRKIEALLSTLTN